MTKSQKAHSIYSEELKLLDSVNLIDKRVATSNIDGEDVRFNDSYSAALDSNYRGLSWNIALLDNFARTKSYIMNAAVWKATRALSNGIDLNIKGENDDVNKGIEVQKVLSGPLKRSLIDWGTLGELHGGSGGLIVVNGKMDKKTLRTPLTPDEIQKGDKVGIKPLTRLYQVQPIIEKGMLDEIGRHKGIYDFTELGKPEYYRVNLSGALYSSNNGKVTFDNFNDSNLIVHRSRLIIYNSSELSWIEQRVEQFFGLSLAERALEKGIDTVVFDRGGYIYHGRIKELADGAREAGLKF